MVWVVFLLSSSLGLFVRSFGAHIHSLGASNVPLQTSDTDSKILIQTLATHTKERIFCCWRTGYMPMIGVPLVSPATEHKFNWYGDSVTDEHICRRLRTYISEPLSTVLLPKSESSDNLREQSPPPPPPSSPSPPPPPPALLSQLKFFTSKKQC